MNYAVELDETDTVLRVIVGDAAWAAGALGGRWIPCNSDGPSESIPGIGWTYSDGNWVQPPLPSA